MARDLLQAGMAFLDAKRKAHATETVTYRRGVDSVTVQATRGRTGYTVHDENGVEVAAGVVDFLITAADLVLGGSTAVPRLGDEIETAAGTFAVLCMPGDGCWRNSDPFGITLRIHTKEL